MVDISTDLINERDTEIRKIVETIAELAQIMRDLSTLVVEQGTMLDRIDHNIQQTSVKVGGGKEGATRREGDGGTGAVLLRGMPQWQAAEGTWVASIGRRIGGAATGTEASSPVTLVPGPLTCRFPLA